jgi:hypothetical protein
MRKFLIGISLSLMFLVVLGGSQPTNLEKDFKPVANETIGSSVITWSPKVNYSMLVLTINRPDNTILSKTFTSGTPYVDLSDLQEERLLDGSYSYELLAIPSYVPKIRKESGDPNMKMDITTSRKPIKQTGYFMVLGGMIVTPGFPEGSVKLNQNKLRVMDEVIYDDLIVDGSLCVGNDCYNGLAFGFDTIVLMENNLRIYFDDTSNTSSFPSNDWRIVINDTTDGGGAYFAVQDVSGGLTPFTIEAGAKTNSLYVDDDGQVGIGTSGPVFELHIKEGDTPSIRLHQSTAYGWPEQIWDVGGNETSFFVRDGTHAARLPFRIEPETPTSTLCLKSDGKVGIGTWSPDYKVHAQTTGENCAIVAERTSGVKNFMNATSTYGNFGTASDHSVQILTDSSWRMRINGDNTLEMKDGGGYDGTWNPASSRELKENIQNLTLSEARDALTGLNPVKYNYKKDKEEPRVGFIAEDVPELVAMNGRKNLGTVDIIAVLTKVIQEQQKFIKKQKRINTELMNKIANLERIQK